MPPEHLLFIGSYASKFMIQKRLTISLTPAIASGVQPLTTLILRIVTKTVNVIGGGSVGVSPESVQVDIFLWNCVPDICGGFSNRTVIANSNGGNHCDVPCH